MTASDRAAELRGIPRESRELGLDKPILSNFSTESHDSVSKCAALLGQVKYTYQKQGPAYEKLLTEYKQRYGMDPASPSMANAYDAATILIDQLRAGNTTPDAIRNGILRVTNYSGPTGDSISFDVNGHLSIPKSDFVIKTFSDGKFVVVE